MKNKIAFLLVLMITISGVAVAQQNIGALADRGEAPPDTSSFGNGSSGKGAPLGFGDVVLSFPSPGSWGVGGLAWDGSNLWASDFIDMVIYKLDPANGAVVSTIPCPEQFSTGLAWDGTNLWCCCEQSATIFKLDPSNGNILHTIYAPGYGQPDPDSACITWDGVNLRHSDYTFDTIYTLDPGTGGILAQFPGPGISTAGLAWDGVDLWHSDCDSDTIYKLDPGTGAVLVSFPSPGTHPWDLTYDGQYLWNVDCSTKRIYKIEVGGSFTLSVSPDPLQGGQPGTFALTNGKPNKMTFLVYSLTGPGSTYIPVLNVTLGLANPIKGAGPIMTDPSGSLIRTITVPTVGPLNFWFQAAQYNNVSNVVATSIQ